MLRTMSSCDERYRKIASNVSGLGEESDELRHEMVGQSWNFFGES